MLKIPLGPHCNQLLVNEHSQHISSQRQVSTILASLCVFAFYSLCIFRQSLIEYELYCIIVFLAISMCISLLYIFVIFLPSYRSQNNLNQWYKRILLLLILSAYLGQG
jgi:hypothetical protein